MRLGIFGGTFNPIHSGHIELVKHFAEVAELDKVLLIPTKIPPHKLSPDLLSGEVRLEMCSLAVEGESKIEVSDLELRREGHSYTIDTLKALQEIYEGAQLYLIMGADMLLCLDSWRDYKGIIERCVICAAERNSSTVGQLRAKARELEIPENRVIISDGDIMTVSSTQIRDRLRLGESIEGLVPERVRKYIIENGLYI
ncbi:MAG: nicotinate (nicotinamide) nucleotide adenylyltransferase [Clostridia bacterium]|nr:nicotinate (nicotinamide) nucleotide adenylyltransferase [Clostridia bacterium]